MKNKRKQESLSLVPKLKENHIPVDSEVSTGIDESNAASPAVYEWSDSSVKNINTDPLDCLNPKDRHKHFQYLKQLAVNHLNSNRDEALKAEHSWKNIHGKDFYVGQQEVHELLNNKTYGVIDQKLKGDEHFEEILSNGFAWRDHGRNGVKVIRKDGKIALYELKDDSKTRLFTDKVYKNPVGDKLIIFDHQGNHDEVANWVRDHNLQEIEVACVGDIGCA